MATLADGPDVEVVELHIWIDGLNFCDETVCVDFVRRLLHQNTDALFRDRINGDAYQDGKNEGANRIGDFPLRSEEDDRSGDDDPDGHDHVAQSVEISGIHVNIGLVSMGVLIR